MQAPARVLGYLGYHGCPPNYPRANSLFLLAKDPKEKERKGKEKGADLFNFLHRVEGDKPVCPGDAGALHLEQRWKNLCISELGGKSALDSYLLIMEK